MTTPGSSSFAPRNPETFFDAQKRNRRATWRMSALCVFAALVMGLPLTLVLTPLLYAVTLLAADIINRVSPLPPEFWRTLNDLAQLFVRVADYVFNQHGTLVPAELVLGLALALLPGMLLAFILWVGMRLLFRHGGVGGTLASLGARDPNVADLKELQLSNVVEEMAIAAGVPAPKVMLIDSSGANAAAIGTSAQDARIVISRRILDDLDREQLQAVLAGQVASIGNGDLSIAFTVTSVFETCGLIITLINSPFGSQSRRTLGRMLRYMFGRRSAEARSAEAEELAAMLSDMLDTQSSDIERFFNTPNPGIIRKCLRLVFFPIQFTNIAVEFTLWFFLNVLLGPCMALLWRTRRYLADTGAVELSRDPDALSRALQRLSEDNNTVTGGEWASHLFAVDPKGDSSLGGLQPSPEQMAKVIQAWQASAGGQVSGSAATSPTGVPAGLPVGYAGLRKEMLMTTMAAATGNAQAAARMAAFAQIIGRDPALGSHAMPNVNDILLAQRGDRAALARLRALRKEHEGSESLRHGQSGLQTHSFLSFHPPLAKRVKRLQRMGATLVAPQRQSSRGVKIFTTVLYLVLGPLLAVAAALMLVVLVMMIGLNLLFLTLWLTVIHWAFAQDWGAIFTGIAALASRLTEALSGRSP
jgi:Zn-dependent protease with chaperone function